jgi:hypothetical protein
LFAVEAAFGSFAFLRGGGEEGLAGEVRAVTALLPSALELLPRLPRVPPAAPLPPKEALLFSAAAGPTAVRDDDDDAEFAAPPAREGDGRSRSGSLDLFRFRGPVDDDGRAAVPGMALSIGAVAPAELAVSRTLATKFLAGAGCFRLELFASAAAPGGSAAAGAGAPPEGSDAARAASSGGSGGGGVSHTTEAADEEEAGAAPARWTALAICRAAARSTCPTAYEEDGEAGLPRACCGARPAALAAAAGAPAPAPAAAARAALDGGSNPNECDQHDPPSDAPGSPSCCG